MRAFVAVEITEPGITGAIENLQSELLRAEPGGARPVGAGLLHITLQFLGEVPEAAKSRVVDALGSIKFDAFDVRIGGVGAFPNVRSPRVVWVGASPSPPITATAAAQGGSRPSGTGSGRGDNDGPAPAAGAAPGCPKLQDLAQRVSGVLGPLGYKPDKPFRPHCTIFRIKRRVDIAKELREMAGRSFGVQRVKSFKLKRSLLTPQGPVYSDLAVVGGAEN
ncbi:MAG: RNA 2',3'-cyclic phosphodiesterase [Thaumarchaeota archaeon]|nr:RNA 2',3'-cyclic phosphodiesterase [Nitrososphaerota archaeon]MDE0266124.1 RNA 2',3'-cyclic phosphodiesterase [Nitrososphaerota archaeon]MDE0526553.1 RNA 2',3'-cyclic phosphodiesterase [Nitrososphaerota archaeon]